MRYKEFGKTGMKVSEMTLGTWGMGGVGWDDNPKSVRQDAIRAAVETGVNFFDTAPAYNAGAAERGRAGPGFGGAARRRAEPCLRASGRPGEESILGKRDRRFRNGAS